MESAASSGLIALIVDEDTATGMLLTGIGHVDLKKSSNFLIVTDKPPTPLSEIEDKFKEFTNRYCRVTH
jgi:V-type H+-transporting ATPase subunit F